MAETSTIALPIGLRSVLSGLATAEVAENQRWIIKLLQCHGHAILTALWRILGSEQDVQDVYQTAVCHLAARGEHGATFNLPGYFYRTAINTAIELLRSRQRQKSHWPQLYRTMSDRPSQLTGGEVCDLRESIERLRKAICQLPKHLQEVIILRDLAQLPYRQVARMLGIRSGTARIYRRQAVLRLADLLVGEETSQ